MNEPSLDALLRRLRMLRRDLLELEGAHRGDLDRVPEADRASARNLIHYLGLRRHDLRALQGDLWRRGLSSLGRAEAQVLPNLEAVIGAIEAMLGVSPGAPGGRDPVGSGSRRLEERSNRTLGPVAEDRAARIMVTMPREAASDPELVLRLARSGTGLVRINTAHDDPGTWRRIVANVRAAERATGRRILVSFDLAGPKLRTGSVAPGPAVARVRPERDDLGRVQRPGLLVLAASALPPEALTAGVSAPISRSFLEAVRPGDGVRLTDARGRRRRFRVTRVVSSATDEGGHALLESDRTSYLVPGLPIALVRDGEVVAEDRLGPLPRRPSPIELAVGDRLRVERGDRAGGNAARDETGRVEAPAHVSCPVAEIFRDVRQGQRILFDDGEIQGVVQGADPHALEVEITRVAGSLGKLRGEKGINLPDTALDVPALTSEDRRALADIAEDVDLVSMSFVQRPEDVDDLVDALGALGLEDCGVILKIETERAFRRLPSILLRALQRRSEVAVMIARGDLAVEVGFERLGELQEEVLWLAEAAHVPTIWATQVLESLAKTGVPSRAEVTDAVAGTRAECVMLNKGPHVGDAVAFLVDVVARSRGHQDKKRPMLRRLRVADFDRL